ncbi:MAG: hypothetical protein COV34_01275 [Candidatus Zambryskibacteria bacterium CG10_big_fil_rev_8_21_14_0_10_42_12]|uniref:Histidyl-tRNA synthetase n=1 Tax=Candidatus Zambryskibacteria bacterium CG10_big_fil_rev_8_21_14_0_10_42_12 TaxID=1975115 RepID=A0A2H0QVD8_9BACT|nr:MAG: hypothetical protein COV34_01275 [Candidatus Zambryskibacteria bacterium CG10_big_fil_rev_8_21_14_0_10_42_12]
MNIQKHASYSATEYEKIAEVPIHYGFIPIKTPRITKDDTALSEALEHIDFKDPISEKIALMRFFINQKFHEQDEPRLFYYSKSTRKKTSGHNFSLDILGSNESIADALLIQTVRATLQAEGFKNLTVHINSMGERDTLMRFEKELGNYLRKHIHTVPDKWRAVFQKNTLEITRCTDVLCESFVTTAPAIVNYLSEPARKHFKEVLEYLESVNIPYTINYNLLANKNVANHTVFEITNEDTGTQLARGFRYGKISKKFGVKKDVPVISASVSYEKPKPKISLVINKKSKPLFYFVHLGPSARLKGLRIIETLREARVPVQHALTYDKISGQMQHAQKSGAKYLIIMGQKEACENSIVVRNIATWKQENIPVSEISKLIKQYK